MLRVDAESGGGWMGDGSSRGRDAPRRRSTPARTLAPLGPRRGSACGHNLAEESQVGRKRRSPGYAWHNGSRAGPGTAPPSKVSIPQMERGDVHETRTARAPATPPTIDSSPGCGSAWCAVPAPSRIPLSQWMQTSKWMLRGMLCVVFTCGTRRRFPAAVPPTTPWRSAGGFVHVVASKRHGGASSPRKAYSIHMHDTT